MSRAETMKLVKDLQKQGLTVERTGSGHWKVTSKDGTRSTIIAFSPGTSGRHKSLKRLRELGYQQGGR